MKESESEAQLCLTLCDLMDCSLPGSSIHGIFQARVLDWVAISFSKKSSLTRDWTWVSHIVGRQFTIWATSEAIYIYIYKIIPHWDKKWSYPSPEMTSLGLWLPKSCLAAMSSTHTAHSRHTSIFMALLQLGHNWNARLREAFTKKIRPIQDDDIWFLFGLQESRVSIFLWICWDDDVNLAKARTTLWPKDGDLMWNVTMKRRHNLEHFIYIAKKWHFTLKPLSVIDN